jgi:uncharacterized protein
MNALVILASLSILAQQAPTLDTHRFRKAVREGDLPTVNSMLKADPGLATLKNAQGASVMILSVYLGQEAVTKVLLTQNKSLDIYEAAAVGDAQRLQHLLSKYPAMVNEPYIDGNVPLHLAAFFGRVEAAATLLKHKANPNFAAKQESKVTPLHSACACANVQAATKLVAMLLRHKADANLKQEGNVTPLHEAARRGILPMVKALVGAGARVNDKTVTGYTALRLAKEANQPEVVAYLKSKGGK